MESNLDNWSFAIIKKKKKKPTHKQVTKEQRFFLSSPTTFPAELMSKQRHKHFNTHLQRLHADTIKDLQYEITIRKVEGLTKHFTKHFYNVEE